MLSISTVSKQTGIPITTLRFYERELSSLFPIRRTAGGHRRYDDRDVARFATVRSLTEEGLALSELKRAVASRGEHEPLREAFERLAEFQQQQARTVELLIRRIDALEERIRTLVPRRKTWFRRE
jgi:DNA-binding transcriptional MerR regulator